jgi:hypothetical protein
MISWPSISSSLHASGNRKRPAGESSAPSRRHRSRYSTSPPSPLLSPPHLRPRLRHPSCYPAENLQEQTYRHRSALVRHTTRTIFQRRRPSETTTPNGMSMAASGRRIGCSEQNQRGVSKSSSLSYSCLVPLLSRLRLLCLYAYTLIYNCLGSRAGSHPPPSITAHILMSFPR